MKEFDAKRFLLRTFSIGYLVIVFLLFFVEIPAGNKDVLIAQVAVLASGISAVFGYWFGSSAGSARKTDIMNPPEPPKE